MPKYWGKQIFTLGSFAEVGQKQKTEREKRERERLKWPATHGKRHLGWRTQAAWAKSFDTSCAPCFA